MGSVVSLWVNTIPRKHSRGARSIMVMSKWARLRLKSPASWLFTQPFVQAQIKENIKAPRHWLLSTVNSPHKGPVTRKMFPVDDVIMECDETLIWESCLIQKTKHIRIDPQDRLAPLRPVDGPNFFATTVKPVCNDHLYNKIYYLWFI